MKRREFLVSGSLAGAALLGANELGASVPAVGGTKNFKTESTSED